MTKDFSYKKGFAHLLLLLVILLLIVVVVVYFVVMGSKNSVSESLSSLYAKPTPTTALSPTPEELDKQLDSVEDPDQTSEFGDVDTDINSL